MKELFIEKSFTPDSLSKIELVNEILSEYEADGYRLTLRQLYYQLVARGHIENSIQSYKRIGNLVSEARLAGLIDWDMIEDRGRVTQFPPHWKDPAEIVQAAAEQFSIDKWADQDNYAEVMVEKDALTGVLLPVCRRLDVGFTANRGYSSSSAMYEAGKRMARRIREGKTVWIFYLGDHDPSGIDMTRDVLDRLCMFSGEDVEIRRLALNMDQVETLNPPENPAKETDSRAQAYIAKFGYSSWELDAVEPKQLDQIVTTAVTKLLDQDRWNKAVKKENAMKNKLQTFVQAYRKNGSKKK